MNALAWMDLSHWSEKQSRKITGLWLIFYRERSISFCFLQQGAQMVDHPRRAVRAVCLKRLFGGQWTAGNGAQLVGSDLPGEQAGALARRSRPPRESAGVKGYSHAQCSTGGVAVSESTEAQWSPKNVPGLFFAIGAECIWTVRRYNLHGRSPAGGSPAERRR
jgi:hypothetical protein